MIREMLRFVQWLLSWTLGIALVIYAIDAWRNGDEGLGLMALIAAGVWSRGARQ